MSGDGRSYSYDSKASGFGRGEGGACLFLKTLDDAIRDGDPIQAVIRSSACNHGGRSDGITMPNGMAHRKLLRRVHEAANLDPSDTAVIEVSLWLFQHIHSIFSLRGYLGSSPTSLNFFTPEWGNYPWIDARDNSNKKWGAPVVY